MKMGMSIDEAINHLGNYSSTNGSGLTTDKQHNEAKRVAIETMRKYQKLEQEPTTKNDLSSELEKNSKKLEKNFGELDCISRQAVLDLIADYDLSMGQVVRGIHALPSLTPQEPKIVSIAEFKYDKDKLKELINKAVLTVTPQEPKTGHWISTETKGVRYAFWCRYKCSLCGGLSDRTNFCPNCGSKMIEPQESENNNGFN